MRWLKENSEALEALGAIFTIVFAVIALIAIKLQIDASDQTQREQSARDIYREHLARAVQYADIAHAEYCELEDASERLTYSAFVEHFLYTAEQVTTLGTHWQRTIKDVLEEHASYLCSRKDWEDYPDDLTSLMRRVQAEECDTATICPVDE